MMPLSAPIELGQWDKVIDARRGHVEQVLADASGDGGRRTEVRVGYPPDELAEAARAADMLVIGSRRWGVRARLLVPRPAETEAVTSETIGATATGA
jgi:nucleotide-binding universal stress UspA family protein